MKNISIGLISAMPQEIGVIKNHLSNIQFEAFGDLTIYKGNYNFFDDINLEITFAWSGWGKVSASRTTTRVISSDLNSKNLDFLIFTGVAGGAEDFCVSGIWLLEVFLFNMIWMHLLYMKNIKFLRLEIYI